MRRVDRLRPLAITAAVTVAVATAVAASGVRPAGSRPAGPASDGQATSADARMASWQRHLELERTSPFRDLAWRAVGPTFSGGRIESIAVHPSRPFTIYVGAGSGNVWKSENDGTTWTPIFEHESTFAVGEIAIAPSNPDVLWLGTGEVLMARSSYAGTGIFKSTDAGRTWANMGLQDTQHIGRVVVDPEDPDTVYVAAIGHNFSTNETRGLYKTTDGGRSWDRLLYVNERVGVIDVELDPTDRRTLYAAAWERDRKPWGHVVAGPGSGLYKSTDAGRTWRSIGRGLPSGPDLGRIGIEIAPSNPRVLYALLDNEASRPPAPGTNERGPQPIRGEVYRSDDRGESWTKVNTGVLGTTIGYDWNVLKISPDDENQIYVAGNRFLISRDGGRTYSQVGGTIVPLQYKAAREFPLDHHALWIDPANPDRVLLGTDHGLYVSHDRTASWLLVNTLPISEFYAVAVDMAEPYNIYGGTQDNAAVVGPSTSRVDPEAPNLWQHIYLDRWGGGDGFVTLPDPADPSHIYYFTGRTVFLKHMTDGTQVNVTPRPAPGEAEDLRYNWMVPFVISPHDPATLYYGANRLFRSTDRGAAWQLISPDLTSDPGPDRQGNIPFGTLTSVSESPRVAGLIYTGADDGTVQVTRDGGRSWTRVTEGLPSKWVSRVTASRHDDATVYLSLTGFREDDFATYLYRSGDYGRTWTSIAANLPAEPVNVVQEDPRWPGVLYVGTDLGVYVTLDDGRSWQSLSAGLPTTPVYDLVVHPRDLDLVIGTHGRSIFVLDVASIRPPSGR
ncbi:MAG: hypothetical protein R2752_21840 [Vicinamibacterales bacterium]